MAQCGTPGLPPCDPGDPDVCGEWVVTFSPSGTVSHNTSVTVIATYTGDGGNSSGTLHVDIKNAGSSCYSGSPSQVSATLPAGASNNQVVTIGSFTALNTCGTTKILKVDPSETEVGCAVITLGQSQNLYVTTQ